jgi:UDP-3-O-[3-hydroxymyristoyl] glucosamine N-acyltransferase
VFIGHDVVIGEGTVIHSGVQVLNICNLGQHCRLFPTPPREHGAG